MFVLAMISRRTSCVWSLTKQNIEVNWHPFLQRIVEAFIQAIVNPFKSCKSKYAMMPCFYVP